MVQTDPRTMLLRACKEELRRQLGVGLSHALNPEAVLEDTINEMTNVQLIELIDEAVSNLPSEGM